MYNRYRVWRSCSYSSSGSLVMLGKVLTLPPTPLGAWGQASSGSKVVKPGAAGPVHRELSNEPLPIDSTISSSHHPSVPPLHIPSLRYPEGCRVSGIGLLSNRISLTSGDQHHAISQTKQKKLPVHSTVTHPILSRSSGVHTLYLLPQELE